MHIIPDSVIIQTWDGDMTLFIILTGIIHMDMEGMADTVERTAGSDTDIRHTVITEATTRHMVTAVVTAWVDTVIPDWDTALAMDAATVTADAGNPIGDVPG